MIFGACVDRLKSGPKNHTFESQCQNSLWPAWATADTSSVDFPLIIMEAQVVVSEHTRLAMFVVRLPCLGSTSIIYHTIRNIPQNIGLERPKVLVSLPFAARCCDQLHSGHSGTATFSPMAKRSSARCFFCGKSRALANVDFGHLPPRYLFPQKAGNVQDLKCLKPKDMKVKDSYQNHPESSIGWPNVHSKKQLWAKQSDSSHPRYLGTIGHPNSLLRAAPIGRPHSAPFPPSRWTA